ncbi:MAG: diguanylate cyclase [Lentisphaerae bacterium RIFOXYC12_FULL_60_16]|nr:MAG: diguanylate cyclase [Lentisphaerae bacterium RIFOXYC12_FULL_60_16]OGV74890.1 MAG: diguanylate cyclase [Lentisphaerae bacterium RIFOXYB12_FULL_60_10]OGV75219.1 MAG: diguanylate cyclase [Lentisphaerae bacterium RIFOXYA12_FULL_60_10]
MNETPDFYRTLLDNLTEGVYFVDQNRIIRYWNTGAEQISGYSAAEVIGHACHDNILQHVDNEGNPMCTGSCPLVRAMQCCKPIRTEAYLKHKDGHRVPVLIRSIPIRNPDGKITGAVELFSEDAARRVMQERIHQLEHLSLLDPLTGVANRRYLDMTLNARFDQMHRYNWNFAVLFMDIDHFKTVNDTWGHAIGDRVLRLIAQTLRDSSRSFDIVGRWGGEEFVVIADNVENTLLQTIAERYRVLIESSSLPVESGSLRVTISIGASVVQPTDDPSHLISRADQCMYRSKREGRNRVTIG